MRRYAFNREAAGIGFALFFLAVGFAVAYLIWRMQISMGDSAVVFLLLIPLLVYLVQTDRLRSFKGPGGLEANFNEVASQSTEKMMNESIEMITEEAYLLDPANSHDRSHKSPDEEMRALKKKVGAQAPIVMMLHLDYHHYVQEHLIRDLENLFIYQTFKFVIFLDNIDKNRFRGYIPAWAFYRILSGNEGDRFTQIINRGDLAELWDFPGVQRTSISPKSDMMAALKTMTENRLDAILLVDKDETVKGVVNREQLLSKLILGMALPEMREG